MLVRNIDFIAEETCGVLEASYPGSIAESRLPRPPTATPYLNPVLMSFRSIPSAADEAFEAGSSLYTPSHCKIPAKMPSA